MNKKEEAIQKKKTSNEILVLKNKNKNSKWFLLIIIIGTLFLVMPHFNKYLWFDEAFSVSLSSKSLKDIWFISGEDVHPVLYYIILHFILLFTNNNIAVAKFFSIIPITILGILGYTHIRKDFGEKVGLFFTIFSFFSPIIVSYAGEIRMYSLSLLLTTLTFTYAYRILKNDYKARNWILLIIFSILASYTHYYSLFCSIIIVSSLMIYLFIKTIKNKKGTDVEKYINTKNNAKKSLIAFVLLIISYIPWMSTIISQAIKISKDYWIPVPWLHDIIQEQISGNTEFLFTYNPILSNIYKIVFMIASLSIFGYIVYTLVINRKNKNYKPIWPVIYIYLAVIFFIIIASIILGQSIIYGRYFMVLTGLFILINSFILASTNKKLLVKTILICYIFISIILNINLMIKNNSPTNVLPIDFVKNNFQEGDTIMTNEDGTGFTIMANLKSENNIFYNKEAWGVEGAFNAFGRTITSLDEIKDFKGRIWIISEDDFELLNEMQNNFENVDIIVYDNFTTLYRDYKYSIYLLNIN